MARNPYAPPNAPVENPKTDRNQAGRHPLAGRLLRLGNLVIDTFSYSFLAELLAVIIAESTETDVGSLLQGDGRWVVIVAAQLLYYVSCESLLGRTLGKVITGTRVVTEAGTKADFQQILLRTLVRMVPFEAFSLLLREPPVGWHDRWSRTRVVRS